MTSLVEPRPALRLVWSAPSKAPATRPLDHNRPLTYPARMGERTTEELLRDQNWRLITAQLTAYAFKKTRRRSWELAEELAHEAIAQVWAKKDGGWNPEKGALFKYLATIVIGLALNEWRRKRNSFEVLIDRGDPDDESFEDPTHQFPSPDDSPEELLDRKRVAAKFRDELTRRVADVKHATKVLKLMMEDVTSADDQARVSRIAIAEIREARRAIFDHAKIVAKDLALELDATEDSQQEEVLQ